MKKQWVWRHWAVMAVLMFMMSVVHAGEPLQAEQAFQVSVKTTRDQHQVITSFIVAPGYHLYASKMAFQFNPAIPFEITKPEPDAHDYYAGAFNITLKTAPERSGVYALVIHYQGCASAGFCYPPTQKTVMVSLTNDEISTLSSNFLSNLLTDQYSVQRALSHRTPATMLLIFFGLGLLLAFTPCVLPMLPILTGLIVGQKTKVSTKRAFLLSLTYVLGMSLAYSFAGLLAALVGSSLQVLVQQPLFIALGAVLFVLLALSLFEFYSLPISSRWQNRIQLWSLKHKGGTYIGVFMMGLIATLMVSPCVTAPLVGVLMYIARTGDVIQGTLALFMIGLGMGVPLIVVGMSAGRWMPKTGEWMTVVTKCFGLLMFAMAIWLIARIIPAWVTVVLWSVYALAILTFALFYFPPKLSAKLGKYRIGLIGLLLFVVLFMVGGVERIASLIGHALGVPATVSQNQEPAQFKSITNLKALQVALTEAKAENKPVLLDFYANWCEACVTMDKTVFNVDAVQDEMSEFVLLRVDMSNHTPDIEQLVKVYNVIAPPTIIFLDKQGEEVLSRRIVGLITADDLINQLIWFISASCDINVQC